MARVTATINGLSFNTGPDGNGIDWRLAEVEGWEAPAVRQQLVDRVGADGSVLVETAYSHRPLVLRGWAICTSNTMLWTARQELAAQLDTAGATDGADAVLTVNEPTVAKRATVRLAGAIRVRELSDKVFEFEAPLVAPDPRKYRITEVTTSIS